MAEDRATITIWKIDKTIGGRDHHSVSITTSEGARTWELDGFPHRFQISDRNNYIPSGSETKASSIATKEIQPKELADFDREIREKVPAPTYTLDFVRSHKRGIDYDDCQNWSRKVFNHFE